MIRTPDRRGAARIASLWLAALASVATGVDALTQDDEGARRHGIFLDSIDVSLINVEVRVTLDGQPVTDLAVDDFEIFDDGESVEITNFFRVAEGRRVGATTSASADGSRPSAGETLPAPRPSPAAPEPSSVLVIVDQPFLSPTTRKQVFEQLAERLEGLMEQGARVMVVSKNRDIAVEQPLTGSREEVGAALDRLVDVATTDWSSEIRRVIEQIEQTSQAIENLQFAFGPMTGETATEVMDARSAYRRVRQLSQQLHEEVRYSLTVMRRFVGSLAGMPGRKALIYVADRLPVRAGEMVWRAWWAQYGVELGSAVGATSVETTLADYDSSRDYLDLIADANASRVSFYPLGLNRGPNLSAAETRGLSTQTFVAATQIDSQDARRWLAAATGGEAAVDRSGFERLFDRLRQDLMHYYSLAYASPHRGDGERHEVEVRVGRPGVELRYLAEYRDKSADQRLAERTLAALLLSLGDNPLGVRLEVGEERRDKRDHYRVPVTIAVPVANLVLLPGRTAHRGELSLLLMVRDPKGRISDSEVVRLPIEIPHQAMLQALSESAVYPAEMSLRRGRQTLAVGVRDDLGQVGSALHVDIEVGGR